MNRFSTIIVGFVMMWSLPAHAEYNALLPGKWKVVANTAIPEILQEQVKEAPPTQTNFLCATQEELNSQERMADLASANHNCTKNMFSAGEQKTEWVYVCNTKAEPLYIAGHLVPGQDKKSFAGELVMKTVVKELGIPFVITTGLQGEWLGECDSGTPSFADQVVKSRSIKKPEEKPAAKPRKESGIITTKDLDPQP